MDVYLKKSNLAFLLKTGTYLDCCCVVFIPIYSSLSLCPSLCLSYTYSNTISFVHVYHDICILLPLYTYRVLDFCQYSSASLSPKQHLAI